MLTHISNNYLFSTVHSSLTSGLLSIGVERQYVYCPLQKRATPNPTVNLSNSIKVDAPRVFFGALRFFPMLKVLWSLIFFLRGIKNHRVKPSFIVAHNLWSDGMVAWLYHIITGTPYIVAVRNTDINLFLPKLPHYRWFFKRIIKSANATVFINRAYFERLKTVYPNLFNAINNHEIIYNGIQQKWLTLQLNRDEDSIIRPKQICFIGSFDENKNLKNSVKAVHSLNSDGADFKFVLIGGGENNFLQCTGLSTIPEWVTIVPKTNDRTVLAKYLSNSRVFLMPSYKETFGLVYIEALSQGCAVIHSKNEGIDGVFNEPFILSVNPHSVQDIASKLSFLLLEFPKGVPKLETMRLTRNFCWPFIAEQYLKLINQRNIR